MRLKCTIYFSLAFTLFFTNINYSQVGIGTTSPHVSSILEIESNTQGMLTPRMDTTDRLAIATPADGLLVYDTDEGAFYHFSSASWNKIESNRDNYKLVRTVADLADELAAGGGSVYLLTSNTFYEINGSIALAAPIDLNGAYISGLDANEDVLIRTGGAIFSGANGGSVRNLTLSAGAGGSIFGLTGSGTETLVFQNCVIANSTSVGSISSFGVVFMNIVQCINNTDGVTFTNIDKLLLSNVAWFSSNSGTFETYVGNFSLIEKVSGFSDVSAGAVGIDVSANPTVEAGVISGTPFLGAGVHVVGYSSGTYTNYFFSNNWNVDCPGLKVENDVSASANFYFNGTITTGFSQTINSNTPVEIQGSGTFTATNLFRFTDVGGNRLVYDGIEDRSFQVNASLSIRVTSAVGNFYAVVLYKNGLEVTESNAILYIDSDTQIQNIAITSDIDMSNGDYIEIYTERLTGSGSDSFIVFSENVSVK